MDPHEHNTDFAADQRPSDTPAAKSSPPTETKPSRNIAEMNRKLDEIIQLLRHQSRLHQHRDFSLMRLIAALAQMFVLGLVIWTIVTDIANLTNVKPIESMSLKLFGAIVLQLIAIAFFMLDRQDH